MDTPDVIALKEIIELLRWALGVAATTMLGMIGIWWKVESGQNKRIDEGFKQNVESHEKLQKKIEETKDELTQQHLQIRDKIEDVWKYISSESKRRT